MRTILSAGVVAVGRRAGYRSCLGKACNDPTIGSGYGDTLPRGYAEAKKT
jgi:hypothetical protein